MNMEAQDGTAAWHGPVVDMDPPHGGRPGRSGLVREQPWVCRETRPLNSAQSQARSHPVPAFPQGMEASWEASSAPLRDHVLSDQQPNTGCRRWYINIQTVGVNGKEGNSSHAVSTAGKCSEQCGWLSGHVSSRSKSSPNVLCVLCKLG